MAEQLDVSTALIRNLRINKRSSGLSTEIDEFGDRKRGMSFE
jgi:hypothetical protein